jgi:hypothetical protein
VKEAERVSEIIDCHGVFVSDQTHLAGNINAESLTASIDVFNVLPDNTTYALPHGPQPQEWRGLPRLVCPRR